MALTSIMSTQIMRAKDIGRRKIEDKIWETLYHCANQPIVSKKLVKRIERLYTKVRKLGVIYTY